MTVTTPEGLLARVNVLEPRIRAASEDIETGRRIPEWLVDEMRQAGLFGMLLPPDLGGSGSSPLEMFEVIEAVSRIDGSAGWIVMIGAGTPAFIAPFVPHDLARELFTADPAPIFGGTFAPRGKAVAVEGGYRVTGRWPFASGIQHCAWLIGGVFVYDGEEPRRGPDGAPLAHIAVMPSSPCQVHDTWDVVGLCGTGSHDFSVEDLFVPADRIICPFVDAKVRPEPQYAIMFLLTGHAAQALGAARHAIDAFSEFAARGQAGPNAVREKPLAQLRVAQAEALVQSARAFIVAATDDAWATAKAGAPVSQQQRALVRLAMTNAVQSSAQAVDLMYDAAGGYAIYSRNPLERCFRDIHVATQHAVVATPSYEMLGRYLLGVEPEMFLM